MKKFFCCCLMIFAMVALTPYAFADTVVGTHNYGWQAWRPSDLDQDGKPYWDHTSSDGAKYNVGYYLTNSGAFSSNSTAGPGAIPFWGGNYNRRADTGGAADLNFFFTGGTERSAALKIEVAGWKGSNVFGWYLLTDATTLHPLLGGKDNTAASATFAPSGDYGFYFSTPDGIFRTQSSLNKDASDNRNYTNDQHFALFKDNTGSYWLGMEDTKFSGSDKDYNDMIVHVSHAPLPGALLLFAPGLVGLALVRRRFTK
jgi:hypothetical protein